MLSGRGIISGTKRSYRKSAQEEVKLSQMESEILKYEKLIYAALQNITYPPDLLEDLVSEGYVTILTVLKKFKQDSATVKLSTYIMCQLKFDFMRFIKKTTHYWVGTKNPVVMFEYDESNFGYPDKSITAHDTYCDKQLQKDIMQSLNKLSVRQAEVLDLRYGLTTKHKKTCREIAKGSGNTDQAVHICEKRGLANLKRRCSQLKEHL